MTETAMFFSPRNAIALLELWKAIAEVSDSAIRQKLRFAFTAILPRASKRYQWSPMRPLNAQNQTYYIAPVYYEWNVFDLFVRKLNAVIRADRVLFGRQPMLAGLSSKDVTYHITSADSKNSSPSYIYANILRAAIHRGLVLDDLHLGDVLVALRNAGFSVSPRTGLIGRVERQG